MSADKKVASDVPPRYLLADNSFACSSLSIYLSSCPSVCSSVSDSGRFLLHSLCVGLFGFDFFYVCVDFFHEFD